MKVSKKRSRSGVLPEFEYQEKNGGDSRPRTYISLFSGAGIGCHGFLREGFECVASVEWLQRRLAIQRHNHKCRFDSGYICGDLSDGKTRARLDEEMARFHLKAGDLDAVIATPPCQGFSICNHKKGDERQRNSLVVSAIETVAKWKPKAFVFENVKFFLRALCADTDGVARPIGEAIRRHLGDDYEIYSTVLNFKNYGCPSSRTRTLVIGTRKDFPFSPLDLLPAWEPERTLRQVIGDLPRLRRMGAISRTDIFHSFREYAPHMRAWIKNIDEGQSAFDNRNPAHIPHRTIRGRKVVNKRLNGDKYRRQRWDASPPCVHTRNDIMASQNTVHPADDRVFSVREVMRMMSIPENFRWSEMSAVDLNALPLPAKRNFLKKAEMNIRQCMGEAAPTEVFRRIAENLNVALDHPPLSTGKIKSLIEENRLGDAANLKAFIARNLSKLPGDWLMSIAEHANARRAETAAYYTPAKTCFKLLENLPPIGAKTIRVLEPAVGVGRILFYLPHILSGYEKVEIDALDIDDNALDIAKIFGKTAAIPGNVNINYICGDFLNMPTLNAPTALAQKYDLVVGNPPFAPLRGDKLRQQRARATNKLARNSFAFFVETGLQKSKSLAFISPKSLLSAPEYAATRRAIQRFGHVSSICDYGESGFDGIRIETIAFCAEASKSCDRVVVESIPQNTRIIQEYARVFSEDFPCWLIYRDVAFDRVASRLKMGVFGVFRDRQITRNHANGGGVRVIKSRNIGNGEHQFTTDDVFVKDASDFAVGRFLNRRDIFLVPNLSYNPRACRLPADCIPDGSAAVLYPLNGSAGNITDADLAYFASDEFRNFYRIARNCGTRSLNIDANSVFFFGVRKND